MITYSPFWSITESAALQMRLGLPALIEKIARIEAASSRREEIPPYQTSGDTAIIDIQGMILKREGVWTRARYATSTIATERAINAALADKDVRSIVLSIDSPGGTVDGTKELSDAVYRANKQKPVVAQADGIMASAAYRIAANATAIYAGTESEVGSIGVRLMLYDFSRMFENAGVEAVAIDSGPLKSAGAEGTQLTDEQRAHFRQQIDYYSDAFIGEVRRARKLSDKQVRDVSRGGTYIGAQAMDAGLIDGVQGIDATLKMARRLTGRSTDTAKARARLRELEAV